jgi:hypothetical protein
MRTKFDAPKAPAGSPVEFFYDTPVPYVPTQIAADTVAAPYSLTPLAMAVLAADDDASRGPGA